MFFNDDMIKFLIVFTFPSKVAAIIITIYGDNKRSRARTKGVEIK